MSELNRHIDENNTARYIDWLRNQGEKPEQSVIDHVEACFECKAEILELADILDQEDQKIAERPKNYTLKIIIRAAAVLAGVLIVALAIEFLRPDNKDALILSDDSDSVETVKDDSVAGTRDSILPDEQEVIPEVIVVQHDTIKYAANFEPSPALEVLYKAHFRSQATIDPSEKKELKIYRIGDTFTKDFTKYSDQKLTLTILTNAGTEILQIHIGLDEGSVLLNYDPGLYYWKLASYDELLEVGKFRLYSNID